MEMKEILSDIQRSIDDLQQKLNLLRGVQTGTLYDVDVAHAVRQIPESERDSPRLSSDYFPQPCRCQIAINIYRSKLGQLPESACIEEYNEEDQTATVHLKYISDLIEPAFVEIDLKRGKVRLIFTRCENAANRYDFNSRFNDNVKTL